MITRETMLRAIAENPDDDAPRLIFTDWLEEQGDRTRRAPFIRIQCRMSRKDVSDLPAEERRLMKCRQVSYLNQYRAVWLHDDGIDSGLQGIKFRRGFVESVSMTGADFLLYFRTLACRAPVQTLCVTLPQSGPRAEVDTQLQDAVLAQVTGCEEMSRLKHLSLRIGALSREAAVALADSPHIQFLTKLHIGGWGAARARKPLERRFGDRFEFNRVW
jgi:uncharacterized protein (TIGR02996 family)